MEMVKRRKELQEGEVKLAKVGESVERLIKKEERGGEVSYYKDSQRLCHGCHQYTRLKLV